MHQVHNVFSLLFLLLTPYLLVDVDSFFTFRRNRNSGTGNMFFPGANNKGMLQIRQREQQIVDVDGGGSGG